MRLRSGKLRGVRRRHREAQAVQETTSTVLVRFILIRLHRDLPIKDRDAIVASVADILRLTAKTTQCRGSLELLGDYVPTAGEANAQQMPVRIVEINEIAAIAAEVSIAEN